MNSSESSDSHDLDSMVTVRALAAGETVFGRYEVRKIVGRGGMGVVWLAIDTELEQDVALKLLPEVVIGDHVARDDLKRETRRSRELTHQHIVRIHDFLRDERTAAISMEYIDGATLSQRRLALPQRVFEVEALIPWIRQLCEALEYAHTRPRPIVHRDLKPANLMVTSNGELKVTDFGIASSVSDSVSRVSRAAGSSGTPVYMSPQQMMGEMPQITDDIYAFGATVYELLTGRPPFYSGNVPLQVQTRVPPSMRERRGELEVEGQEIPQDWEDLVAACLAKEPQQRPHSFRAIAKGLKPGGSFEIDTEAATIVSGRIPEVPLDQMQTIVQPRSDANTEERAVAKTVPDPAQASTVKESSVTTKSGAPPVVTDEKPAAEAAAKPKKRRGVLKWGLAIAALAAIAAGVAWRDDTYGRYQASEAAKQAASAMQFGDWGGALEGYGRASELRPQDPSYQQFYDMAQRRWLDEVEAEIEGLSPEQAHVHLQGEPARTAAFLDESNSRRFTEMVDEAAAGVRKKIEDGMDRARALALSGDFAGAYSEIDDVVPYKSYLPDFDVRAGEIREIEARNAAEKAVALAAGKDFEGAMAALDAVDVPEAVLAEHAGALKEVREAQVRHEVDQALARAASGDFDGAVADLESAARRGILGDEVESAKTQVVSSQTREEIRSAMERAGGGDYEGALDQLQRTGRRGALSGEVAAAQKNIREARARDDIQRALDASGRRDFDEALALLETTRSRGVLTEEIDAAQTRIREDQVRREIGVAMDQAEQGNFEGAIIRLEAAESRGLLLPEIAEARAQVHKRGEDASVERLAPAIMAGNATEVREIIEEFEAISGEDFETTAEQLLAETNLGDYLEALEELQLRPTDESQRDDRTDLALVEAQRGRFDDPVAVASFLGQNYLSWADELAADGQYGYALYLLEQAKAEGASVDAALERSAIAGLTRDFDFRLYVARTEAEMQTPPILQNQPVERLRARISPVVGKWMPVTDEAITTRATSEAGAFFLRSSARGVTSHSDRRQENRNARYQSGWNTYQNPEYADVAERLRQAEYSYNEAVRMNAEHQRQVRDASNQDLDRTSAILFGVASGLSTISTAAAQGEVNRLREQLENTPRTIREPTYANEPYTVITHMVDYSAEFGVELDWQGKLIGKPQRFRATSKHETVEVNGNQSRGVPVKRPVFPDTSAVARTLADDLSKQVVGASDVMIKALTEGTFRAVEAMPDVSRSSMSKLVDRQWGLLRLWSDSGITLPKADVERSVREQLGLPATKTRPAKVTATKTPASIGGEAIPITVTPVNTGADKSGTRDAIAIEVEQPAEPDSKEDDRLFTARELDKLPRATSRRQPTLPRQLRRAGVKGTVVLSFVIDERGRVRDIEVVRTDDKALVNVAQNALERWRFKPGEKNGRAVPVRVQQTFHF